MALPFWMLRELKVRTKQKVGLAILFSIALFTVALDIVRTVEAIAGKQDLYTILELNFNVIVSCLPSYRALLKINQRKATKKKYRGPSAGYSGDSYGGPSRRGRKGSIPWLNRGRSRSTAGVLDEAHFGASAGMRNGNKARDIELNSSALRSPRGASGSQGARPKDPYAIESESRTSLVDPKSSTIKSTAEEAENPPTSRMMNETKQHSDRDSTEIWDSHRHELPGEVC
ncbi:MAG: hypothetical protein LQ340_004908 [Diploschistes diacapsis]|nr:MAG: hypothetical protein LQ340_004908 [Diploschistes diacapsis]